MRTALSGPLSRTELLEAHSCAWEEAMTTYERLRNLITGFMVAELAGIAARLRLAEILGHGPRSVDDLALDTGLPARNLLRLLRGLEDIGMVRQAGEGFFASTPLLDLIHP